MNIINVAEIINAENYLLKVISLDYTLEMFLFRSDKYVCESEGVFPDKTEDDTIKFINKIVKGLEDRKWIYWVILNKENELVGSICIWNLDFEEKSAELGYGIRSSYQNKGIMSEVLPFVEDYAFRKMEVLYLNAFTNKENKNSIKLLNKLGYVKTGEIEEENQKGEMVTMVKYSKEKSVN